MEKYITKDDYLIAKGINLDIELQNNDNASRKVERFIEEVTDWCVGYLITTYAVNELNEELYPFSDLAEFRQKFFRKGVIEQIEYMLSEGDISVQSGINEQMGIVVDYSKVQLGHKAYQAFKLGAFCNIGRQ